MAGMFSLAGIATIIADAIAGKTAPEVNVIFDGLEAKFPDGKPLIEALRAPALALANLPALAEAAPASFADMLTTLKNKSGPVDDAGGETL